MIRLKVRTLVLPAAVLVAAAFACKNTTETKVRIPVPATIVVAPDPVTIVSGLSRPLAVAVFDDSGTLMVGVAVSYASSDPSMATVSAQGVVTSVGPAGQATVTVTCSPASKSVPVVVVSRVAASLTVSPPSLTLHVGDSTQLTATVRDQTGALLAGATVTFTSSDTTIAAVSAPGVVHGVRPGNTVVTATSGSVNRTVPVQVKAVPPVLPDSLTTRIPTLIGAYGIDVSGSGVVFTAISAESSLVRMSLATLAPVDTVHVGLAPTGVAFSPDGNTAYVTNQGSGTLGVVNVAADSQVATVAIGQSPFVTLPSPDGSKVIVTGNAGSIYVVNASTRAVVGSLLVGGAPNGLAFNAAGTRVYVSTFWAGTVVEVDPATPAVLRTFTAGGYPQGLALSADGTRLYIANETGFLEVRDIGTGARLDSIPLAGAAFDLARSPDDSVLYVGLYDVGKVMVVDRVTFQVAKTLVTGGSPRRIAFTADGRHAVIANQAGWVDVVTR